MAEPTPPPPPPPPRYTLHLAYDAPVDLRWANRRRHVDPWYAAWHLRRGSARLEFGGERIEARAGDWVFCDPYLMRSQRFGAGTHLVSVRFGVFWRGGFHFLPLALPRVAPGPDEPLLSAAMRLVEASATPELRRTLAQQCRVTEALHAWLALWHERRAAHQPIRPVTEEDPAVNRLIAALGEHRGVGVLDYAHLRETVGLSRSQIDRLCKSKLGMTPRQWCERRSLSQAEQWLRAGRLSVKQIAYELGFVDGSHFSRWFRRQTGQSPTAYRGAAVV